jgi:aspartate racemase
MNAVIGILGGMGPRATVQFEQLLLERLPGSDQHIPTIITVNDGGIPDRSSYLIGKGQDPLPRMVRNALTLERAGVSFIAMPCNTACAPAIYDRLAMQLATPLLNLPALVIEQARNQQLESVLLLATPGTIQAGGYQQPLRRAGIDCILPNPCLQTLINTAIQAVKTNNLRLASAMAQKAHEQVARYGAPAVILGCTELPLIAEQLVSKDMLTLDSLAILADACVAYTKQQSDIKREDIKHDARSIYK